MWGRVYKRTKVWFGFRFYFRVRLVGPGTRQVCSRHHAAAAPHVITHNKPQSVCVCVGRLPSVLYCLSLSLSLFVALHLSLPVFYLWLPLLSRTFHPFVCLGDTLMLLPSFFFFIFHSTPLLYPFTSRLFDIFSSPVTLSTPPSPSWPASSCCVFISTRLVSLHDAAFWQSTPSCLCWCGLYAHVGVINKAIFGRIVMKCGSCSPQNKL